MSSATLKRRPPKPIAASSLNEDHEECIREVEFHNRGVSPEFRMRAIRSALSVRFGKDFPEELIRDFLKSERLI